MSIDAELRAGHIDHNEARRRRAALARESQLFGSMDGALKFVKGDAIAGIVVLAVNIVGGLIVGILQRGMDAGAAARTYTVLTIGEGLVSQIPALVISTSAGIIVTRVASEEEGGHLGRDIGLQIMAQPKALAIAAGLLALLAIVPGLPTVPFLTLAVILGAVAWKLLRTPAAPAEALATGAGGAVVVRGGAPRGAATEEAMLSPLLTPIAVEVSAELGAYLDVLRGLRSSRLRERLFAELGLPLPAVRLSPGVAGTPRNAFVIRLNEVLLAGRDRPRGTGRRPARSWATGCWRCCAATVTSCSAGRGRASTRSSATHPALVREVVPAGHAGALHRHRTPLDEADLAAATCATSWARWPNGPRTSAIRWRSPSTCAARSGARSPTGTRARGACSPPISSTR